MDRRWLIVVVLVAAACAESTPSTTSVATSATGTVTSTTAAPDPATIEEPSVSALIPDAAALNVASNGVDDPVVAWTTGSAVMVATFDPGMGTIGNPVVVSGDLTPFVNPIERPAVAVAPDGEVTVAFIALTGFEGSVYLATWDRASAPTPPQRISGDARPETALVHITLDPTGAPFLSWLEDSTLSAAIPEGEGLPVEHESIDGLTCDCCHPVPALVEDALVIGYRDLVHTADGVIRDISMVVEGPDGFSEAVPVADDHWYLDACPFSGPAMATIDGDLVVAWMDARQSVHPDQRGSTIWVDRSSDGGASFGTDVAVTSSGTHRYPVMAVEKTGKVHLIWETLGSEAGLVHSVSVDGGRSFSAFSTMVAAAEAGGAPGYPSAIAHNGLLVVTWTDRAGGHVAAWLLDF